MREIEDDAVKGCRRADALVLGGELCGVDGVHDGVGEGGEDGSGMGLGFGVFGVDGCFVVEASGEDVGAAVVSYERGGKGAVACTG